MNDPLNDKELFYQFDAFGKGRILIPSEEEKINAMPDKTFWQQIQKGLSYAGLVYVYSIYKEIVPFSYRGYMYDGETGLYYNQSRYYSGEWGRFINADDPMLTDTGTGTPNANNMFAYCENDPINYTDNNGYKSSKTYKIHSYVWGNCSYSKPDTANIYLYLNGNRITTAKIKYWKKYNSKKTFIGYMAQLDNRQSYAKRTSDYCLFYPLAQSIYYLMTIRYGKSKFQGRTVNGIFVELVLHYALYSMGILRNSHTNTTEMGGTNTDGNAKYFESLAKGSNVVNDLKNGNTARIKSLARQAKGKA